MCITTAHDTCWSFTSMSFQMPLQTCAICPAGTFSSSGASAGTACKPCSAGSVPNAAATASGSAQCQTCAQGLKPDATGTSCKQACYYGYVTVGACHAWCTWLDMMPGRCLDASSRQNLQPSCNLHGALPHVGSAYICAWHIRCNASLCVLALRHLMMTSDSKHSKGVAAHCISTTDDSVFAVTCTAGHRQCCNCHGQQVQCGQ